MVKLKGRGDLVINAMTRSQSRMVRSARIVTKCNPGLPTEVFCISEKVHENPECWKALRVTCVVQRVGWRKRQRKGWGNL